MLFLLGACLAERGLSEATFTSPGFTPTRMDDQGRLIEDWGALGIKLTGDRLPSATPPAVQSVRLDQVVPAAQGRRQQGPVECTLTAFRAPVWPGGLDVLTVQLRETAGAEVRFDLALELPEGVRLGTKSVSVGGRMVVALPAKTTVAQELRDWGYDDEATSLPGWGRPAVDCDPAFRNIRAGLDGVPIVYRFKTPMRASFNVILGFCESHWAQSGQRPVVCRVEGAPTLELDPLARWGQHQPGAVAFAARDDNADGYLDLAVLPAPGAPDQNPILNVIWVFPPDPHPGLDSVIAGKANAQAWRYVDVGGTTDQSLRTGGTVQYAITLPANGARELTFLVACPGATLPAPDRSTWTPATLRQAAVEVWRDWKQP